MNPAHTLLGKRLSAAFGNTAGKIGILIALASVIGTTLMRSGGAERIIRSLLNLVGKKNASLAFLSSSFTLAIPVFFDTVFYLMIPLVRSMGIKNPRKFSLYLMSVIAAAVMAHSLIPPTPGPLFVAEEMGIDLGVMMLGGLLIGVVTVGSGYAYAVWANRRWDLPMRDTPDLSMEELEKISSQAGEQLPSLVFSLAPILLPVFLITGNTILNVLTDGDSLTSLRWFFTTFGDSNIALFLACIISMLLLWRQKPDQKLFRKYIYESLMGAGLIILITSAGGAFGQMLQQTNIGSRVADLSSGYQLAILPLAFFLSAAVRTAQGSATVAMITTIGIIGGFTASAELPFHPVYIALVIGCGSKIFAWMNDSGFWIISKMSGMTEKETIQHFSIQLTVMGFVGLISCMLLAWMFPLI